MEHISFQSIEDIQRMKNVGIRSSTVFLEFNPEGKNFLLTRKQYVAELESRLKLECALDYSVNSLKILERELQSNSFTTRQELERHFLGLLSYVGEVMASVEDADFP